MALGSGPREREPETEAAEPHLNLDRRFTRGPERLHEAEPPIEAGGSLTVRDEQDDLRVREVHGRSLPFAGVRPVGELGSQLTAFLTRAVIRASASAVSSVSA